MVFPTILANRVKRKGLSHLNMATPAARWYSEPMPSRFVVLGIVLFWVASMSWLTVREVLPRFQSGDPPPFVIDLTDEVSASAINWAVLHKNKRVGSGFSTVSRAEDNAYNLKSEFKFDKFELFNTLPIRKLSSRYQITPEGNLLEVEAKVYVGEIGIDLLNLLPDSVEFKGKVREGFFHPQVVIHFGSKPKALDFLEPVRVSGHGSIMNPMHLLNRVAGLHAGQRWVIPLLDPVGPVAPGAQVTIPKLEAEVHADTLTWAETEVPCFRIDYREPGGDLKARTWVRRRDGLVLQQQANHEPLELLLIRETNK
jgi:hypothetical protein